MRPRNEVPSLFWYVITLFLALVNPVHCQTPYEMTADEIDCSQETRKCIAKKHARVSTGAKGQVKTLTAEVITASMQEEGAASHVASQVIDAEGNVVLKAQEDTISIRADKARYEPYSQKAVFKGNVLLRFGSHVFKGDEAAAELEEGNFILQGRPQAPVNGLIYPDALAKDRHRL